MIPEGYKKTELGLIPNDWELISLLSKCELLNGLTYKPENIVENGLLVIRSSNIQNGKLVFLDNVYVNLTVDNKQLIKENDIIICVRNGSANLIGKCAKAYKDYAFTFGAFMAVLRGQNNDFIYQVLQQGKIQKQINKNSAATINQITNGDFKKIVIPFPTYVNEQYKIANALSDIDELISALEQLIEKKKNIKQGIMQELLTGKRRLPGFSGEWKYYKLNEIGSLSASGVDKKVQPEEKEVILINYSNVYHQTIISRKDLNHQVTASDEKIKSCNVKKHDVFLTPTSETPDEIAFSAVVLNDMPGVVYSYHVVRLRPFESFNGAYINYAMGTDYFRAQAKMFAEGSGIRYVITLKKFNNMCLYLPNSLNEQNAIVSIISDIDKEIEVLENKLEKTIKIKSGMMSELLTGKKRLV